MLSTLPKLADKNFVTSFFLPALLASMAAAWTFPDVAALTSLRSFDVPRQVYGADAIPVWTRLASVVSKDYAAQINDARARVDCFVNVTCLAIALSLVALGMVLLDVIELAVGNAITHIAVEVADGSQVNRLVLVAFAGLATSFFSYRWAVASAKTWGEVVKSAFDCYLPALINQLGYAVPSTEAERKAFWEQFNARVLYQFPTQREWPPIDKVGDEEISKQRAERAEGDAPSEGEKSPDGCANQDRMSVPSQQQDLREKV